MKILNIISIGLVLFTGIYFVNLKEEPVKTPEYAENAFTDLPASQQSTNRLVGWTLIIICVGLTFKFITEKKTV